MSHGGRGAAPASGRPTVAIIGGGLTGAVLAHQLARRVPGFLRIVVIEPRDRLGAGLAYSTTDAAHRINVPATRMSFVPSDPCHFDRWLKSDPALAQDPEALTPDGRAFPQRAVFGRYAAETIEPYLMSGAIEHRRTSATAVRRLQDGYAVTLDDGAVVEVDAVALAATHPSPQPPAAIAHLKDDPRLIVDTQVAGALDAVATDARVLIVGSGLTMADIVASLDRRGHRGPITAVSRRGLLSRGHVLSGGEFGAFAEPPSRNALALLRRIRATLRSADRAGAPWQHVLDAVRTQGPAIWNNLPEVERAKVVRRLRAFWDVHRFRVAPQVEAPIARLKETGQLTLLKGEPVEAASSGDGIEVALRLGGRRSVGRFDAIALATGPAHRSLTETSALVAGLAAEGLVAPDAVGLGLATDKTAVALGPDGAPSPLFFIAGPLARGAFGELMGLPEVPRHAELVAREIVRRTGALADARALKVA